MLTLLLAAQPSQQRVSELFRLRATETLRSALDICSEEVGGEGAAEIFGGEIWEGEAAFYWRWWWGACYV